MKGLINFLDALNLAGDKKHVLLGNGFSIDWNSDIFRYEALVDRADFSSLSVDAQKLFGLLNTKDFEVVIEALRNASALSKFYATTDPVISERFAKDAEKLKGILAATIAKNHPDQPNDIKKSEYEFSRRFLTNFSGIYTLNYDLLLYWALMHKEGGGDIKCDDGFRNSEDDSADYVVWDNGDSHAQNIHYVHGALHLFDAGTELQKFTWTKTGIRLIDQVRSALDAGLFPLFVAEGSSDEKITRINHSGYLHKARRSFSGISGSLFIHGHSLADSDDHIISMIPETKVNKLFISMTSDLELPANSNKVLKIQSLIEKRKEMLEATKQKKNAVRQELQVYFYDAETAHVWR